MRVYNLVKKTVLIGMGWATAIESPTGAGALSLPEAVQTVLKVNSAMDSAEAQSEEARSGESMALASYIPRATISSAFTQGNNPVYAFGTLLGQSRLEGGDFSLDRLNHPSSLANIQGQTAFQMQVFNWQRKYQLESARAKVGFAREGEQMVRQSLIMKTIEAYYDLMLARSQLKILNERIRESEEEIKDATSLKEQGLVLGSDYHLARAVLGRLKQQSDQDDAEALSALSTLNILMARPERDPIEISGSLDLTLPPDLVLADLKKDLNDHPLMRSSRYSSETAVAELKIEAHRNWPVLSAFSVLEANGYKLDSGGWNYLTGIRLAVPLFDPGYRPQIQMKKSGVAQAEAVRRMTDDDIRLGLVRRYDFYKSAMERLGAARETEDEARSALDLFKKYYHTGRQSIADVLQGESALALAEADLQKVYYDLRVGYSQAQFAAGLLWDAPQFLSKP